MCLSLACNSEMQSGSHGVSVQVYQADDARTVVQLHRLAKAAGKPTFSAQTVAEVQAALAENGTCCLIARVTEAQGEPSQLVGAVVARRLPSAQQQEKVPYQLLSIVLRADYRGQGLGALLLRHLMDHFQQVPNAGSISCWVLPLELVMAKLLQAAGFIAATPTQQQATSYPPQRKEASQLWTKELCSTSSSSSSSSGGDGGGSSSTALLVSGRLAGPVANTHASDSHMSKPVQNDDVLQTPSQLQASDTAEQHLTWSISSMRQQHLQEALQLHSQATLAGRPVFGSNAESVQELLNYLVSPDASPNEDIGLVAHCSIRSSGADSQGSVSTEILGVVTGQLEPFVPMQSRSTAGATPREHNSCELQESAATRHIQLVLLTLVVLEAVRKQGLATALLAALIVRARDAGACRVVTDVAAGNAPAVAFFKSQGFKMSQQMQQQQAQGKGQVGHKGGKARKQRAKSSTGSSSTSVGFGAREPAAPSAPASYEMVLWLGASQEPQTHVRGMGTGGTLVAHALTKQRSRLPGMTVHTLPAATKCMLRTMHSASSRRLLAASCKHLI